MKLDEKGRCCGRKPIEYRGGSYRSPRDRQKFCDRCDRAFNFEGRVKTLREEVEKVIEKHREHARFAKMSKMASISNSQADKWNLVMRRDEFIADALQSALDRTQGEGGEGMTFKIVISEEMSDGNVVDSVRVIEKWENRKGDLWDFIKSAEQEVRDAVTQWSRDSMEDIP